MRFRVTNRRSSLFVLPSIARVSSCLAKHDLSPRFRLLAADQRTLAVCELRRHPVTGLRGRATARRVRQHLEFDLIVCGNESRHRRPPIKCGRSKQPEPQSPRRPMRAGEVMGAHGRKLLRAARCCTVRMLKGVS